MNTKITTTKKKTYSDTHTVQRLQVSTLAELQALAADTSGVKDGLPLTFDQALQVLINDYKKLKEKKQ